jgi:undecaprenyl pyrophosphate phosphatase UppP
MNLKKQNKSKFEFYSLLIVLYVSWTLLDLVWTVAMKNSKMDSNFNIAINSAFIFSLIFVNPWMWWLNYKKLKTKIFFRTLHIIIMIACILFWVALFCLANKKT